MVVAVRGKKLEFSSVLLYISLIEASVFSANSVGVRGHLPLTLSYQT